MLADKKSPSSEFTILNNMLQQGWTVNVRDSLSVHEFANSLKSTGREDANNSEEVHVP